MARDVHCEHDRGGLVDAFGIDLRSPLYAQVGVLGERYWDWVHAPIRKTTLRALAEASPGPWAGSVRIFASPPLERLTHISWRQVLAFWVPVIALLAAVAHIRYGLARATTAGLAAGGLLLWTLVEYLLHRFLFHARPRSPRAIRLHFLAHGIHHLDPFDGTRLVFPPLAGAAIALVLFLLMDAVLGAGAACAVMAGLLAGYLLYDLSHYVSHHGRVQDPWFRYLQRYHAAHHHRDPDALFGVSSPLWDLVFRTGAARR